MITHPPKEFVKYGDTFTLISVSRTAMVYKRRVIGHSKVLDYYEVFRKQKRRTTDKNWAKAKRLKVSGIPVYDYPRDEDFGIWAWVYGPDHESNLNLNRAMNKFNSV